MTGAPQPNRQRLTDILIAMLVVVVTVLAVALSSDDSGTPISKPKVVNVRSANGKLVPVHPAVVAKVAANAETHLGGDGGIKTLASSDKANPDGPVVKGPVPLAAGYQRGCLTRSAVTNYSYRNGTKPSIIPIHLTVSPNIFNSWADVNSVWAFLNRSSTQANIHYIVDGDGHCIKDVPETLKAWNVVSYNSAAACGIEVINTGNESVYIRPAGMHQLAVIVHDCAARWHIPLQLAEVSNGQVLKAGVIDHYHLGLAGGGHGDIHNFGSGCHNAGPNANTILCVEAVIRAARAIDNPVKPVTAGQRARCRELHGLRVKAARPHTQLSDSERARGRALKDGLHKHRVRCVQGVASRRA